MYDGKLTLNLQYFAFTFLRTEKSESIKGFQGISGQETLIVTSSMTNSLYFS